MSTFQSSPALSGRCNPERFPARRVVPEVSILTGPFGPVQHPPDRRRRDLDNILFQSSPALSGRCNYVHRPLPRGGVRGVSILTGPFGPVQPSRV